MTIALEPELEQRVQEAAKRAGQGVEDYVSVLLMRQLAAQENTALDRQAREERLRRQFEDAMNDPLFVQDMEETMEDYKYIDSEAARMMDEEYGKEAVIVYQGRHMAESDQVQKGHGNGRFTIGNEIHDEQKPEAASGAEW